MKWAKVTIVGKANVGKSTLINSILKDKIAGVTSHPGTTVRAITGELKVNDLRIFFVDTPGIIRTQDEEEEQAVSQSIIELMDTDLIYFMIDAHTGITKEDTSLIEKLQGYFGKIPIFLVINKIDGVPKEKLLPFIQEISEELYWDEIIPVSAKRGTNIDELLKTTLKYIKGKEGEPPQYLTMVDYKPLFQDVIREKVLRKIKRDAARKLRVEVEEVDLGKGRIYVKGLIVAQTPSVKAMVIGKKGQMIKEIGTLARKELEEKYGKKVFVDLTVVEEKR